MDPKLHQVRASALRLERYCRRVKDKIWSEDQRDLINALADIAEVGEVARRLYLQVQQYTGDVRKPDTGSAQSVVSSAQGPVESISPLS